MFGLFRGRETKGDVPKEQADFQYERNLAAYKGYDFVVLEPGQPFGAPIEDRPLIAHDSKTGQWMIAIPTQDGLETQSFPTFDEAIHFISSVESAQTEKRKVA